MSDPQLFFGEEDLPRDKPARPKLVPADDLPPLEEWIPMNTVTPYLCRDWTQRYRRKALHGLGVTRQIGPKKWIVVVALLREKAEEIYQKVLEAHIERHGAIDSESDVG